MIHATGSQQCSLGLCNGCCYLLGAFSSLCGGTLGDCYLYHWLNQLDNLDVLTYAVACVLLLFRLIGSHGTEHFARLGQNPFTTRLALRRFPMLLYLETQLLESTVHHLGGDTVAQVFGNLLGRYWRVFCDRDMRQKRRVVQTRDIAHFHKSARCWTE